MSRFETFLGFAAISGMAFGVYAAPDNLRGIALVLACGLWFLKGKS